MKKLKLQIDDLAVETFQTAGAQGDEGTVVGHATQGNKHTCDPQVGTCFGYTCYETCGDTCADTCQYTCDPLVGTCFGYTCAGAGC
ncbi:MAG TPA: hypothetical protein VFR37_11160 [Longimicrobium sp.]|nr:hypothetical protein [Longimicrobium sp.]